jgi:uncharacterized protein VirK/YbjX
MTMTFLFLREPLKYVAKTHPSICFKYLGKYLALFLNKSSRFIIFKHHYITLLNSVNSDFFSNIIDDRIVLWQEYKNQNSFDISLIFADYGLEGDLSLIFSCNSQKIFTMSFTIVPGSIIQIASKNVIFVSRVQGISGAFDTIRFATKELNDICPRNMLLEAVQAIAIALGAQFVVGLCAKEQIFFIQILG